MLIDVDHSKISLARQCELLGLARSTFYYAAEADTAYDEALMRLIDEQYTRTPVYGVLRMTAYLCRQGHAVGPKRVRRLMRQMGLMAIYPKPRLSAPDKEHRVYPYLLRGLPIVRPDQVWSTDITYIRLRQGFVYLVAILDWHSRYVLSWRLSTTLHGDFCIECLEEALTISRPEIFNTDQGSQFTSRAFTGRLEEAQITISMDGCGRAFDNIFIERLWRSVKYEEVFLHDYTDVGHARQRLGQYFDFYNNTRLHQALGYATPTERYFGKEACDQAEQPYQSVHPGLARGGLVGPSPRKGTQVACNSAM